MPRNGTVSPPHWKAFADRRRNPASKREAVLKTAVQLFLEKSYARTSLNDVADRLKITKPALYHYFRSKEEIFAAVASQAAADLRHRLREVRRDRSLPFEERIYRAYLAYFEFVTEERALFAVLERQLWHLHERARPP